MKTIDTLIQLQKTERLSDEKFAQKFKVHRTTWILIKIGKTKRPLDFLVKVKSVYPGLKKQAQEDIEKILSPDTANNSN